MRALQKFCEHEQASTHLIFASSLSKGKILRGLSNWMGPYYTPNRECLFLIAVNRERTKLFPVIREQK